MMWSSVDAVGIDLQPVENNNQFIFIPFTLVVIFIIVLLFLNLFVGVVVETFNTQKELLTNNHCLTSAQRTYLLTYLMTFSIFPKATSLGETNNRFRKLCMRIASSKRFEFFIMLMILLNTLVMALVHYQMSDEYEEILEYFNKLFMAIFIIEAFIKIVAHGKRYFKDGWNIFDFTIIISATVI